MNNIKTLRENLMDTTEYKELKAEIDKRTGWLQKIGHIILITLRVAAVCYLFTVGIALISCTVAKICMRIKERREAKRALFNKICKDANEAEEIDMPTKQYRKECQQAMERWKAAKMENHI